MCGRQDGADDGIVSSTTRDLCYRNYKLFRTENYNVIMRMQRLWSGLLFI